MGSRSRGMKAIIMVATVAILALAIGVAAPAVAVPFNEADFNGYSTGNLVFAKALSTGTGADEVSLANATEGFTGAAVDSNGLNATIHNEMNRLVIPAKAGKNTYGRGSGLEVGLSKGPDDLNDLELQKAEASALPNEHNIADLLGPLSASPLAYASALHGEAEANWSNSSTCVLGKDLSNGLGYAADVQLIETGTTNETTGKFGAPLLATDAPSPERAVAQTFSHEFLDVQQNATGHPIGLKFGLSSEVRQTIAPVTLFKGTPNQITIEVGGEWVLRATAGGIPGSAFVHYGPGTVSPQIPLLRVLDVDNNILGELNVGDILPAEGLPLEIPGVISLVVGEDPRRIGDYDGTKQPLVAANGTSASAAVDVVRITALDGALADIRIGHSEVKTQVPVGGIDCGIPVTKSASPVGVTVNQDFTVTIKIDNPFGCDLTHVKVVDVVTTKGGARFQVIDTDPNANTVPDGDHLENGVITWNDIGAIPKGGTKSVKVSFTAQNVNGEGGEIIDVANVSAILGNCTGEGEGNEMVGTSLPLRVPVVLKLKLPPTGVGTSATAVLGALTLLSLAVVSIRQLRRTH
jgi:hypothetical protein